jgi:hypothetical protein
VHILNYKPGARTERPFAQLTIYALALTRLINPPLRGPINIAQPTANFTPLVLGEVVEQLHTILQEPRTPLGSLHGHRRGGHASNPTRHFQSNL